MKEIITLQSEKTMFFKRKRVAAYARVSVESEPMLHSVNAQISYYSKLIQNNPDWDYIGVYADRGITGTKIQKRDAFQELMNECEKGNVDIILCKSISRFARNTVDLLESVRHLKKLGVEVRFERENISSFSKEGELILTILASFAQEESRSISENVKWGMRRKYASGEAKAWNKHVYGYRFDDELNQYVFILDEAKIVREIFNMYLNGESFRQIANILNSRGVKTTNGCKFDKGTIGRIIGNEIYTGNLLWQKKFVENHLTKIKKLNRGELPKYLYENCHKAIINHDIFEKAQEIRSERSEKYCRHILGYKYDFALNKYFIIPEEAESIRCIFSLYLDGLNYMEIAKEVTRRGIRTVRGNCFTRYSIGDIIRNDFYGTSVTDDKGACHEAILDNKIFVQVLAERERRKNLQWKQF